MADTAETRKKKQQPHFDYPLWKLILRQVSVFLLSLCIVLGSAVGAIYAIDHKFLRPVDPDNTTPVTVEIPMGTSVSGIADILYENHLIRNKAAFKLFIDFSNKGTKLKAGRYKLSQNMSLEEIMDKLVNGMASIPTKKFTIVEGMSIREIAHELVDKYQFSFTEEEFLKAARVENFTEYLFLQDIPDARRKGEYPLEGYLFPETYIVYEDASPQEIIRKMLTQFDKVFKEEYRQRAEELGLTMDEVVILASIVEREARLKEEFPKIAAVFHNRLRKEMKLESCATVLYALYDGKRANRLVLTTEETQIESPYNTYMYSGLPVGPIASPGELAIKAVLYPDESMMDPKKPYLYFVLMDPEKGQHAFNTNYNDHLRDKQKYEKLWQ